MTAKCAKDSVRYHLTSFGLDNVYLVIDKFDFLLNQYENSIGISLLDSQLAKYKIRDFTRMKLFSEIVKNLTREAENIIREENNLPRVGEGWIEETILFNEICKAFPKIKIVQHGKL